MSQVDVYDASGVVFDDREIHLITELPPIPQWFQDALTESGGTCEDKPNVIVVSGLDPMQQEWVGGRWWRKYAFREHTKTEYCIWHKPDGTKKAVSKKEAEVLQKSRKLTGIITEVVDRIVTEHPIPRYFVEFFRPASYYGSEEAWEHIRWNEDESGKLVDLMGEFPREGRYETWFCIEEPIVENGVVVRTEVRYLDDTVLGLIKHKIEEVKNSTASEQHLKLRKEAHEKWEKDKAALKSNIKDIVADRVDRLLQ
jgi:hypothetical protein